MANLTKNAFSFQLMYFSEEEEKEKQNFNVLRPKPYFSDTLRDMQSMKLQLFLYNYSFRWIINF